MFHRTSRATTQKAHANEWDFATDQLFCKPKKIISSRPLNLHQDTVEDCGFLNLHAFWKSSFLPYVCHLTCQLATFKFDWRAAWRACLFLGSPESMKSIVHEFGRAEVKQKPSDCRDFRCLGSDVLHLEFCAELSLGSFTTFNDKDAGNNICTDNSIAVGYSLVRLHMASQFLTSMAWQNWKATRAILFPLKAPFAVRKTYPKLWTCNISHKLHMVHIHVKIHSIDVSVATVRFVAGKMFFDNVVN